MTANWIDHARANQIADLEWITKEIIPHLYDDQPPKLQTEEERAQRVAEILEACE